MSCSQSRIAFLDSTESWRPSLPTSDETLTIRDLLTLRARFGARWDVAGERTREECRGARGASGSPPDPELVERPKRRRFTAKYKLEILEQAEACTRSGEIGELLRREGLYTSHLTAWRKQRKAASQLLRAEGISLDRAHTHVEGATTRGNLFRRAPATDDLRALLEAPARAARARHSPRIEVEDLLLSALDDPAGGASRTLRALGVQPDAIREALKAGLDAGSVAPD